jgi:hypothetical protein
MAAQALRHRHTCPDPRGLAARLLRGSVAPTAMIKAPEVWLEHDQGVRVVGEP